MKQDGTLAAENIRHRRIPKKIEDKNPDGLTFTQFVDKYPRCRKIAIMCWHLGCYPEELRQELKNLLEEGEPDA